MLFLFSLEYEIPFISMVLAPEQSMSSEGHGPIVIRVMFTPGRSLP